PKDSIISALPGTGTFTFTGGSIQDGSSPRFLRASAAPPFRRDGATLSSAAEEARVTASSDDERVEKSAEQWRKDLNEEQFRVTRLKGTEPAFTGKYHDCKEPGVYRCVCCGAPLFEADT